MSILITKRVGRARQKGFTLIEALAALMLVAVVLPFAIRGISMSAQGAAATDQRATAMMLAQTQLEEAMLAEAWKFGDSEGAFDEIYGPESERYTWSLTVEEWINTNFRELTLTVTWTSAGQEKKVDLKTVVYADSVL